MVLLNLLASLSLVAAVGVPAVVSSKSEIEESSASYLNRKNSSGFLDDSFGGYVYQCLDINVDGDDYYVLYDGVLPATDFTYDVPADFSQGYGVSVTSIVDSEGVESFSVDLLVRDKGEWNALNVFIYDGSWHSARMDEFLSYTSLYALTFGGIGGLNDLDYYRVILSTDDLVLASLPRYLESKNIVPSITNGLGVVSNLASGLVGGFDSLALNDGALTNVMAFAFTLLGIGTAVGVAKLCFNWVTGRHGM